MGLKSKTVKKVSKSVTKPSAELRKVTSVRRRETTVIGEKIAYIIRVFEGNDKTSFARKIGIKGGSTGLVHDWLNGKAMPKQGYRSKICEAYADKGVDMEWLNDDNETGPPSVVNVCVAERGYEATAEKISQKAVEHNERKWNSKLDSLFDDGDGYNDVSFDGVDVGVENKKLFGESGAFGWTGCMSDTRKLAMYLTSLINKRFDDIVKRIDRLDRILCGQMSFHERDKKNGGERFE